MNLLKKKAVFSLIIELIYNVTDGKKVSLNDFLILKPIGKGGYGEVRLVKKKDTGENYAMKILSKKVVANMHQKDHTKSKLLMI